MDEDQHEKAKSKTKFGMMMSGIGRSAGKGFSRAGKQMQKGMVKAKQTAVEKIAKVPISPEDPDIVAALERLKTTKTEIYAISDVVRNLYEARVNEATFMVQLADKLQATKVSQNDPFGSYLQRMGSGLSSLEKVSSEHLKRMEEELVVPLEKFRDSEVESVQKLKLKYKNGKTQYDIAAHRLTKAQESQDAAKIGSAAEKKKAAEKQLFDLRNDMKFQVNNMEQKKQVHLLQCIEQYWSSYSSFAAAQSSILAQNQIEREEYAPPSNIEMIDTPSPPGTGIMDEYSPMDDHKESNFMESNTMDSTLMDTPFGAVDANPPPPAFGVEAKPPPPAFGGMGGMPPPPDDTQSGFEYYDESAEQNGNKQPDDYNPFDD